MLAVLLSSLLTLQQPKPFDFYQNGPYNPSIPKPESILGYKAGEHTTNFRDQERVDLAILAKASDRVRMIEYGKTAEGRPLRVYAISSPENIKRLDDIRNNINQLAWAPLTAKTGEIIAKTPCIVWINECIHGNESASFESGMWLLYNLAAGRSAALTETLKNTVVILNPVYNPDGHERFAVWFDSVSSGSVKPYAFEQDEPGIMNGRLNHYRFDMNRDRVAMSQLESQQESNLLRTWNPQVYADQHGQVGTYFMPPCPMAINSNVGRDRYNKWTDVFGRATANAFDKNGWLYFVKDSFDLYYPGYLDSFASLNGAIGMTHETDGGSNLGVEREDGSIVWLLDGIKKHFTSALAVISAAASHREELLTSFANFKRDAATGKFAGKFQRVIVAPDNPRAVLRLAQQLSNMGIGYTFATASITQKAHSYWSDKVEDLKIPVGSLVVDMAQPEGPLAKAMLSPGSDFEAKFTEEAVAYLAKDEFARRYGEGPGFYDMTAWCLIYGHDLKAWWCEEAPPMPQLEAEGLPSWKYKPTKAGVGWYLVYRDIDDILAIFDLMNQGVRVSLSSRPMHFGGASTPRGTFLIFRDRNEDGLDKKIEAISKEHEADLIGFSTSYPDEGKEAPGSESIRSVKKPNVAIVWDPNGFASFGSSWFLMEKQWKLPFTAVPPTALTSNLDKYTCVVVPGGRIQLSDSLKSWVRGGGCLVLFGGAEGLIGDGTVIKWEARQVDNKPPAHLPGSLFKALLDTRNWLGYGYAPNGEESVDIAVPIDGTRFYKAPEGGAIVGLSADPKATKLLSGWAWPNNTEKALEGAVWAHVAPLGQGNVVIFTHDPTERAMWPGLHKMVLNSVLLGAR